MKTNTANIQHPTSNVQRRKNPPLTLALSQRERVGAVALILLAILMGLTGCAGTGSNFAVKKERVVLRPAQTNEVAQVITNQVAQVVTRTNDLVEVTPEGFTITRREVTFATNYVAVPVTNYLQVVLPEVAFMSNSVAQPLKTAADVAGTGAGMLGVPFVDAGLQIGLAGLGIFLAWRNKRNRARALAEADGRMLAESKLQTAISVGETLVDNFEDLRKAALKIPEYQKVDPQVMKTVQMIQAARGVKAEVNAMVEERTDFTTK